jgi:NADH:ubiquinone oxidoreductase subunit 4 (subunit M)
MIALVVILGVYPAPLLTLIGPSVDTVVQLLRFGGMP